MHWTRRTLIVVLSFVAILLIARLFAPLVVRDALNRRLHEIPGYSGTVSSVDLRLWRGSYRIDGMRIVKSNGKVSEPFFAADRIDFSVAWRELIHGRFVSRIYVRNAKLNLVRGASDESSQLTADNRWQDVINDIFPIDITFLDIRGGVLRFVDETHTPKVDIVVRDLSVHATGLQNRPDDDGDPMPAKIDISGVSIGDGQLHLFVKLEPLAVQPHFDLALELKKVSMPALNDFLRAYAKVEVSAGQFEVFAQMAMRDGHYEGYVKPFIENLKFSDIGDDEKSLGKKIWKSLVTAFANLATNKDSKQMATRIPFSGEAKGIDVHVWKTIENGLHHGFIKALSPGFEGTTHPDGGPALPPAPPAEKPSAPKQ